LILKFERDRDYARDLTQECFCNAWRAWTHFRGDSSVQTWLSHIAVNVVKNHARRQRRWGPRAAYDACTPTERADTRTSPASNFLVCERIAATWNASRRVSSQQQTALRLRFVNDLTTREIAELMAISEGAVKAHLSRALGTIRTRLLLG
jgi:RNA polymerase sigma-70 factor (ECF subfamily)